MLARRAFALDDPTRPVHLIVGFDLCRGARHRPRRPMLRVA